MKETSKSNKRRVTDAMFQTAFSGDGIDIGGGTDPLCVSPDFPNIKSVKNFDTHIGNAQYILEYEEPESYDFVYSSHCLEHMLDPLRAIMEWGSLVKSGGHMVIVVPDEDLYEQGVFPSRFNADHKFTFTIDKLISWSTRSVNMEDLMYAVCGADKWEVLSASEQHEGYDLRKVGVGIDQTRGEAEANIEVVLRKL